MTKLICFDMDGIIFQPFNFWLELHKAYGTYQKGRELTKKYVKTDYQTLVKEVVGCLWKNQPAPPYFDLIKKIKYFPGAKETLKELKKLGYKIAVISSGPSDLAERVKKECKIDYYFTNQLLIKNNQIAGTIEMEYWPIRFGNKANALKQLCQKHHLDLKDIIVVCHEDNDLKMARIAGFSLAFNPTSKELVKYCNVIVEGDNLNLILEPIKKFEVEKIKWTS